VHADDGVRLWVNGLLILDQWGTQDATFQKDVYLGGGTTPLRAEFFERGWGATLTLNWQQVADQACAVVGLDLRPYTPAGQLSPVVAARAPGTLVTGTLVAGQPAYFDWYFINDGLAGASNAFAAELWVDGQRQAQISYVGTEPSLIGSTLDQPITVLTPGWHTVKLVIDPANAVAEIDEANNTWAGDFYWQPAGTVGGAANSFQALLPQLRAAK
jgi:hypothetical protein